MSLKKQVPFLKKKCIKLDISRLPSDFEAMRTL